ncbi:MAG: hypothetical protein CL844_08960 [Crocinitomicaceae bacterium]|nr:hypothetical protein [Crocinitomicaceae bacterium]|tara:strand:- start:6812 stop:8485 length:1674 start_codon:yes stop_codon:yes gene_type:complete
MKKPLFYIFFIISSISLHGQNELGSLTGNVESIFQYLNQDSLIEANQPDSKSLINTYMNVFYTNKGFKAGFRIESYLPRIQGYPNRFDGTGLGMRYIGYQNNFVDVTLGSFYEQFGSGMSLRAYEDRALGYDNLLDGVRLVLRPFRGVILKGVYGLQRYSFESRIIHGDGIVRGIDSEFNLNSIFKKLEGKKLDVTIGGSFVSKYQSDENQTYVLPENTGAYGGRASLRYGRFNLDGEYIIKGQDPSTDNGYIYNYGHAALFNFGYSQKGLGIVLSAKSVDNMSYRSDRTKELTDLFINFLPAMNKTHTYNLVSSIYPYVTQPVGEIAYQAEILYTIKRGSKLGGKYGTSINANFSTAYKPLQRTENIDLNDSTGVAYESRLFDQSDSLLWRDINVNIYRKFTKNFNARLSYFNICLNNDVAKVTGDATGIIQSHIGVVELGYKINKKHSLRLELQGLFVNKDKVGNINDKGNWATLLLEYNVSPHWFFSVMDQYNYGNPQDDLRVHYIYGSFGYIKDATRITIGYGKQREGLFCVGGVCRFVPASNGLTLSFTHSF